jgi:hypothetical protein
MRRVALLVAFLFLLLFTSTVLTVVVATSALGDASGDVRLLVGAAAFMLFFTGIWLVGRSVRRMFGPIGDVLEAAVAWRAVTTRCVSRPVAPARCDAWAGRSTR